MKTNALFFTAPGRTEVREISLAKPGPGELLVETCLSAISSGSEMLLYRGEFPDHLPLDGTIPALQESSGYPCRYGYAAVGTVCQTGSGADGEWEGRQVFCFHPHQERFVVRAEEAFPLPEGMEPKQAVFFPSLETAVSLVMDAAPLAGERVVALGQGVIGLLVTRLLAAYPLECLFTVDRYPLRRELSRKFGAGECLDADDPIFLKRLQEILAEGNDPPGADLAFELSGNPAALNNAINLCGFAGRIVVGSFYGKKTAQLELGGKFHRNRLQLISSQVSHISPGLNGRWTKERRRELVWRLLRELPVDLLISHRTPFSHADEAYRELAENPARTLQIVLTY